MELDKITLIYTGTTVKSSYIAALLKENRIDCSLRNRSEEAAHSGFATAFGDQVEVYVYENDVELALKIIKESEA